MREWQMVTVAFRASSSWAIGLPTSTERPTTTASAPDRGTSYSSSSVMTPAGVHGRSPGRPWASSPALAVVSPSTSFSAGMRAISASESRCFGVGSCSRMPETAGSAASSSMSAAAVAWSTSPGRWRCRSCMPASTQRRRLLRT